MQPVVPRHWVRRQGLFLPDRVQTGNEFSPQYDAFHIPFPDSPETYITSTCAIVKGRGNEQGFVRQIKQNTLDDKSSLRSDEVHDKRDPILKLPAEIIDLILSYLSPATLDAARHVNWSWRRKILGNCWVLSTVLDDKKDRSPSAHRLRPISIETPSVELSITQDFGHPNNLIHRDLLKKLDQGSNLPSTYQHRDSWRTRFRIRHLDFEVVDDSVDTALTHRLTAAVRTGVQYGFMVFQTTPISSSCNASQKPSTLLFYRFDSSDTPLYVGAAKHAANKGLLKAVSILEIEPQHAVLKLTIGDQARFLVFDSRKGFSNSDCRFVLTEIDRDYVPKQFNSPDGDDSEVAVYKSLEGLPNNTGPLKVLAHFPPDSEVSVPATLINSPR